MIKINIPEYSSVETILDLKSGLLHSLLFFACHERKRNASKLFHCPSFERNVT